MAKPTVLIVDDEETIRYALQRMLEPLDVRVVSAGDGEQALTTFEREQPDLVLLDIMMPKLDGLQVCQRLKYDAASRLVPIIIITSSSATENRLRGIEAGADDFLAKPFDRAELTARVRSLLRIKRYTDELEEAEHVLFALARAIEGKDPYTEGHCERLAVYAQEVGRRLGLPDLELVALRRAGIVHDIGKIAVPDAILLKAGPLTPDELTVMRQHPLVGEGICQRMKSFRLVLPIIRHHHEKLDGTGYPNGLAGESIPLTARIITVVDVFDALTTDRPYRVALALDEALRLMQAEVARGWWDAKVFDELGRMVADGTLSSLAELAHPLHAPAAS